jgi:aminoglycoside phosphotransferase (APT) family kinase protein
VERTLDEALTRKMRRRGHVAYEPVDIDTVEKRLEEFLSTVLDEPFAVGDLSRLTGGASMEQFTFRLRRGTAGDESGQRMVLRMTPPSPVNETDRLREFQIMRAVEDDLPVPHAYWVAGHDSAFGVPAMITSFDPGVAAPTDVAGKASGLATVYGELRTALAPQVVKYLAELHRLDWSRKDLSALDVPTAGTTEAVDWRLALLDRMWDEDTFEAHPTMALAREWLWDRRPAVDQVSLVHGDYRNGNFLFDESDGRVTTILDWELGFLGDRHYDLAYLMLPGFGYYDESGTYLCAGLQDAPSIIADYERLSGLRVDPERLRYYTVLCMYWGVVACMATSTRIAAEKETHVDVVMNLVTGLAVFWVAELNRILGED